MDNIDSTIRLICENITTYGLVRYDPRDISEIAEQVKISGFSNITSKLLQVMEAVNPIVLRKVLGCHPRLYPTTFTFLSESMYDSNDNLSLNKTAVEYMSECISTYYCGCGYWKYHPNTSYYADKTNMNKPSMPLYMLTRCNNLLARLAIKYDNPSFMKISLDSLYYMFQNHYIFKHEDGTENISYYYNSIDNTINVNSEVLDWIVQIPDVLDDDMVSDHFKAILKGVLNEQNEDGSWYYYSREHMSKYGLSDNGVIDCHHSATVIYNLIHVYHNVEDGLIEKEALKNVIVKAMKYFTACFFDDEGNGITIIGKMRKASSVQYGEAIIAIIDYLRFVEHDEQYAALLEKMITKMVLLVKCDGSAPGDSKIKPININNINWGNGPVLYALTHYVYQYER